MIVGFYLSMPNNNSWNGKWSGAGKLYARVASYRNPTQDVMDAIEKGSHYYNFGDGWTAKVDVIQIEKKEAARIRKHSVGFCGYDWMIDSILQHGRILNDAQAKAALAATPEAGEV